MMRFLNVDMHFLIYYIINFDLNFLFFPDPESGNRSVCIEAKIENFFHFCAKIIYSGEKAFVIVAFSCNIFVTFRGPQLRGVPKTSKASLELAYSLVRASACLWDTQSFKMQIKYFPELRFNTVYNKSPSHILIFILLTFAHLLSTFAGQLAARDTLLVPVGVLVYQ